MGHEMTPKEIGSRILVPVGDGKVVSLDDLKRYPNAYKNVIQNLLEEKRLSPTILEQLAKLIRRN